MHYGNHINKLNIKEQNLVEEILRFKPVSFKCELFKNIEQRCKQRAENDLNKYPKYYTNPKNQIQRRETNDYQFLNKNKNKIDELEKEEQNILTRILQFCRYLKLIFIFLK